MLDRESKQEENDHKIRFTPGPTFLMKGSTHLAVDIAVSHYHTVGPPHGARTFPKRIY